MRDLSKEYFVQDVTDRSLHGLGAWWDHAAAKSKADELAKIGHCSVVVQTKQFLVEKGIWSAIKCDGQGNTTETDGQQTSFGHKGYRSGD